MSFSSLHVTCCTCIVLQALVSEGAQYSKHISKLQHSRPNITVTNITDNCRRVLQRPLRAQLAADISYLYVLLWCNAYAVVFFNSAIYIALRKLQHRRYIAVTNITENCSKVGLTSQSQTPEKNTIRWPSAGADLAFQWGGRGAGCKIWQKKIL